MLTITTKTSETLRSIWEDLNPVYGDSLQVIKHVMHLHTNVGVVSDLYEDPEKALLTLEKHKEIHTNLK